MSKDIPMADFLEWCKERNYALVAREDFPYLFKDIVTCGECKHRTYCYSEVHITNTRQTIDTHKDIGYCSYGERKNDDHI